MLGEEVGDPEGDLLLGNIVVGGKVGLGDGSEESIRLTCSV